MSRRLRSGLVGACRGLPAVPAGLLPALAVGDTSVLAPTVRANLQAAGLTHLTAVSGANLAITAGAVHWAAARMGLRRGGRVGVSLAVVAGFVVVARPQPSVLRAAAMGVLGLAALLLARRPKGMQVLGGAVTALLVADPWLARNAGFGLSCAATAGLLLLAPVWTAALSRYLPRWLAAGIAVPAAAQAACGPIAVLLQPQLTLMAVPANLAAEPAVPPATIAGVLAAVIAPVWPTGAHACAALGTIATAWIVTVASRAAAVPESAVPWPSGVAGALLLALLTAAGIALTLPWRSADRPRPSPGGGRPGGGAGDEFGPRAAGRRTRPGRETTADRRTRANRRASPGPPGRGGLVLVVLVVVAAAGAGWCWAARSPAPGARPWPPPAWAVAQCDVGQGAALVLRTGGDRALLVDAGPLPDPVDRCLTLLRIHHLDLVILTHHHADHVLGLAGALRHRDAAGLLVSPLAEPPENASTVRRVAARARVAVQVGRVGMASGAAAGGWGVRWRVLAAGDTPVPAGGSADDGTAVNASSLVTLFDVTTPSGPLRVLGLGDLETEAQERLLAHWRADGDLGAVGQVDVLEVAHHGSARQAPELCPAVAPRVALIGVGLGNDYGHPAPSTVTALRTCGARVARTDLAGDIAVVPLPGGALEVRAERSLG
jgi:competence protein ComEC